MSTEPLNVRVARALGWTDVQSIGIRGGVEKWVGKVPGSPRCQKHDVHDRVLCVGSHVAACFTMPCVCRYVPIPTYGQESPEGWACTGPLLRYVEEGLGFGSPLKYGDGVLVLSWGDRPDAHDYAEPPIAGRGATWGEALCNLVLQLAEAGRLREGK